MRAAPLVWVLAGCPVPVESTCVDGWAPFEVTLGLSDSRLAGLTVTVDDSVSAEWELEAYLSVVNPTPEDCPVAVYLSREPFDPELAPVLSADEVPPAEVAGFGERVDSVLLSRQRESASGTWQVYLLEAGRGGGERHLLVVGCDGLELSFWGQVTSCDDGLRRSVDVVGFE